MRFGPKLIARLLWGVFQAAYRHILRTGYYPPEWPLKLALIMGAKKALLGSLDLFTAEEVSVSIVVTETKLQDVTSQGHPLKSKGVWILEVPVTKTVENAKRTVEIVNTAFARLSGDISGLRVTEDDVASLSAEWTAIKSDASAKGTKIKSKTNLRKLG
jgi:hypothetical protein